MPLPALPESFSWKETPSGPVLTCAPLGRLAPHLFTTRALPLSGDADWRRTASLLGAERAAVLNQVHGRNVVILRRTEPAPMHRQDGDALISDDPAVALGVKAADCVPLLLADSATGAVAAVHAGWRGTAARVAAATVEAMTRELGTRPHDITVAIGPCIRPCCYEVGPDVVDAFAAAGHTRELVGRWVRERVFEVGGCGRLVLDVALANRDQLVLAGVPDENVFDCGLCTAMHLEVLTSFRAEREHAGRIAGLIRAQPRRP